MKKYIEILILSAFMLLILLFTPLGAEIVGYEYVAKKDQLSVKSDMDIMLGTKTDTELYNCIARDKISTTLDTAVKDGKAYKQTVYETKDVRPNGITATFISKVGTMPADLNYDSAKEREKLIQAEILKQKEATNATERAEAIKIVDGVSIAEK